MPFKPVNHIVYVLPDGPVEKSGAIILPPTSKRQTRGIVRRSNSALAKVGDHVAYNRIGGLLDGVGDEELVIVYERDLVGVDDGKNDPFPILPASE